MAVSIKTVRAALDPEEPDYEAAAALGADALPHLEALVTSGDPMLASKATYLASLIRGAKSAEIVDLAARSDDSVVRVAAAAAASNLSSSAASPILENLVGDSDAGVRKVARASVPDKPAAGLARKLEELADEAEPEGDDPSHVADTARVTGFMPGEAHQDTPGSVRTSMPGERFTEMPGEESKMPGE
jgi:hypothetical protein